MKSEFVPQPVKAALLSRCFQVSSLLPLCNGKWYAMSGWLEDLLEIFLKQSPVKQSGSKGKLISQFYFIFFPCSPWICKKVDYCKNIRWELRISCKKLMNCGTHIFPYWPKAWKMLDSFIFPSLNYFPTDIWPLVIMIVI